METDEDIREVRWSPRVKKSWIRRLYENDARGIYVEDLINEVGYALYLRSESILTVTDAMSGQVACPRCARQRKKTLIPHKHGEELLKCLECGWQVSWSNYHQTFQHKQLYGGGAVEAFRTYVKEFDRAQTPREKLLAIDRVIHEFHYSLQDQKENPHRPAGVNLIEGQAKDVVAFLDRITYGDNSTPETHETLAKWRTGLRSTIWKRE